MLTANESCWKSDFAMRFSVLDFNELNRLTNGDFRARDMRKDGQPSAGKRCISQFNSRTQIGWPKPIQVFTDWQSISIFADTAFSKWLESAGRPWARVRVVCGQLRNHPQSAHTHSQYIKRPPANVIDFANKLQRPGSDDRSKTAMHKH